MIAVDIEPPSSDAFLSRHRDLVPDVNNPYPVVDIPNVMERVEARIAASGPPYVRRDLSS